MGEAMKKSEDKLIGKTIKEVETEMYDEKVRLYFTDGSHVTFAAGRANAHNDFWSTVYIEDLQEPERG